MKRTSYSYRGRVAVLYGEMASVLVGRIPLGASPGARNHRSSDAVSPMLPAKSNASRPGLAKGQTAVEFAMVASVFFVLLFGVMDYGWMFFAQLNVQQAVDDGGRFASTGNHTTVVSGGKPTTLSRI